MYTVLIVDDEEPVLDGFTLMLSEGIEGFECAGVARSGYDAMKSILELRPDVVFMDINMPGIDGLETISRVHDSVPDTVFILATAYERFDLARRAIPLGVQAYLVKPITRRVFTETLATVRERLDRERPQREGLPLRSDAARDLMERAFLRDELSSPISGARWSELREALGLDSDRALVAFAGLDPGERSVSDVLEAVNASLALKYRFLFSMHLGQGLYFVSGDADCETFARDLSAAMDEVAGRDAVRWIGAGNPTSAPDFGPSYAQAFARLREGRARSGALARDRLGVAALRQKLGFLAPADFRVRLAEWRDDLFASLPFEEAKLRLVTGFVLLFDDATGFYRAGETDGPVFVLDAASEAAPLCSAQDCARWSDESALSLAAYAERNRSANLPVPLVRALSFIAERYHEPLQLADVAEEARVSSAYLSRIFGEHLSVSFVEYLTALRVETAERLLRERSLSVKEVAHAVGFQDPNYFSKAFRKRTGLSPSAYAGQDRDE